MIGAGAIGTKHAAAAVATEGVELALVCDRDGARAQELAEEHGAASADNEAAALGDASIDGVVIAVPNRFHTPMTLAALEAGKHVLLEKPMAITVDDCRKIVAAVESSGKHLQIGHVHRFTAMGKAAKDIVDAGELGSVYHAKAHLYLRRSVPGLGGWFTNKEMSGGGAMIDLGVHLLDLALYLTGFHAAQRVSGSVYSTFGKRMKDYVYESMWAGPPRYDGVCDVEDSGHALIHFEGGMTLDLNVCWAGNFPDGSLPDSFMGFFGDRGGMTFHLYGDHVTVAHEHCGRNVDTRYKLAETDELAGQMADFLAGATGGASIGAKPRQSLAVQTLVDAVYQSSEKQETIVLG
ncbi:MAG: Gfo/Idh/MocA family oxidoreductase [Planctomycetota bacterium]